MWSKERSTNSHDYPTRWYQRIALLVGLEFGQRWSNTNEKATFKADLTDRKQERAVIISFSIYSSVQGRE